MPIFRPVVWIHRNREEKRSLQTQLCLLHVSTLPSYLDIVLQA